MFNVSYIFCVTQKALRKGSYVKRFRHYLYLNWEFFLFIVIGDNDEDDEDDDEDSDESDEEDNESGGAEGNDHNEEEDEWEDIEVMDM